MVKEISSGTSGAYPKYLTNVNGTLFFQAYGDSGRELWQSDGTSVGTTLVKDIVVGGGGSLPKSLTNVNGKLFFTATDGSHGIELWTLASGPPPGITVNPTSGLVTTEEGGTATFTVVLDSEPTAAVTIGLSSNDTTEGTVSPTSVTFTVGDWSSPQTVTVTGQNDALDDGNIAYSIVTAAASSGDAGYNGLNAGDVSVSNTDDDTAGITVNPTSGLITTEEGGTATFTVKLDSEPTADVTIGLSSNDTTEGTVSPASVTFTAADWSSPKTVTVTGVADTDADGNIAYTIVTAAATSTDPGYSGRNAADVSVTNNDLRTLHAALAAGILTVSDNDAAGRNNNLTISTSGGNLVLSDPTQTFDAASAGVGTLSDGNRTLTVPLASLPSGLVINAAGGNDSLTVNALAGLAGSLTLDGGAGTDAVSLNGTLTPEAGRNLSVTAESLAVGSSGALTLSGAGAITWTVDNLEIDSAAVVAVAGTLALKPQTAARPIDLGTETAGALSLTNAELARLAAGRLEIGDGSTGVLTISQSLTAPAGANVVLASAPTAGVRASADGNDWTLGTGKTLSFGAGTPLVMEFSGSVAALRLGVGGNVDLTGATLTLQGTHTPAAAVPVTVVTASGTLAGRFTGLEEGGTVTFDGETLVADYAAKSLNLTELADLAPVVDSVQINDGSAQRSMVTRLVVTFNTVVWLDGAAGQVQKVGGGNVGLQLADLDNSTGKTVVTLTFTGAETEHGSLTDGNYELTVLAAKVRTQGHTLDGDKNGTEGDNYKFGAAAADKFFRFFGDSNGDRLVNTTDLALFRKALGKSSSQTGYQAFFDYDADGVVDSDDYDQFLVRYRARYLWPSGGRPTIAVVR